jgi:hypothetical protein
MRRLRYASAVAVMIILSVLITFGGASAAVSSSAEAAATTQTLAVSSTTGWQQTSLYLTAGQKFTVQYVSGCWTVDYRNFPCVGPQGYSSQEDAKIYQDCKFDGLNSYGVLYGIVGQVANGAFPIGKGGTFTATAPGSHVVGAGNSGYLYLRINDTCLTDNAGSVTMRLTVLPAPAQPVVVTKTALSADTVMGVTVRASFSPAGSGNRLKLNYLWFDASAPGLRCAADATAKGIKISSNNKTVWQVATGPSLLFGPGISGAEKNAYIYLYGKPTVYVTGGKASIDISFALTSWLLDSGQVCSGDQPMDLISIHIQIP